MNAAAPDTPTEVIVRYLGLLGLRSRRTLVAQMEPELDGVQGWLAKRQIREAIAICQSGIVAKPRSGFARSRVVKPLKAIV